MPDARQPLPNHAATNPSAVQASSPPLPQAPQHPQSPQAARPVAQPGAAPAQAPYAPRPAAIPTHPAQPAVGLRAAPVQPIGLNQGHAPHGGSQAPHPAQPAQAPHAAGSVLHPPHQVLPAGTRVGLSPGAVTPTAPPPLPKAPPPPPRAPVQVQEDPIALVEDDDSAEPIAEAPAVSKIKTFGADWKQKEHQWKRTPNATGQGAVRVKSFHGKYSDQGLEYLDDAINAWLDNHPEVEVKFVTSTVNVFEGKIREPALVLNLWY